MDKETIIKCIIYFTLLSVLILYFHYDQVKQEKIRKDDREKWEETFKSFKK